MWRVCYYFRHPTIGPMMHIRAFWHEKPTDEDINDFGEKVMWPHIIKRFTDCVPSSIGIDDLPTMAYFEYPELD